MNAAAVPSVAAEINRLHEEASRHAVAARSSLHAALTAAWQAGQLLLAEKKRVRRTMGGGAWLLWLEQNFHGKPRTAQRYMKLAQSVADAAFLQGMSLRRAYSRLGIPMEPRTPAESVRLQPIAPHVLLVNQLVRALQCAGDFDELPPAQRAAIRQDLSPLYRRMRPLFEPDGARPANFAGRALSEEP